MSYKINTGLIVVALLSVSVASNAHAYVDPGSGSAIMSAILGVFAAGAYMVRKQFYKLKNLFKKSDKEN
ncbi:MAG: hypothetical protein HKO02_03740 [Hyphomonadaceae bacterium]|nr:hypothetical protein [Hyphomonadaceae bacterium]